METLARPSRDEALMATARVWAERGTCSMLQVGAVFSRDGRILVQGYNGAPAGLPHCEHKQWTVAEFQPVPSWVNDFLIRTNPEHAWPSMRGTTFYSDGRTITQSTGDRPTCSVSEHAERNGVAWAARNGVRLEGSEIHVTNEPCSMCAMAIINAGVNRVVYSEAYRFAATPLLVEAGLEVLQLDTGSDRVGS